MAGTEAKSTGRMAEPGLRPDRRFNGLSTNKIDAKGRISIPADLRRKLDPESDDPAPVMYCLRSPYSAELICGGPDLGDIMLEGMESIDPFHPDEIELEETIFAAIERFYFDENGRVVIPKDFRDHAGLQGAVSFMARGDHFAMVPAVDAADKMDRLYNMSAEQKATYRTRMSPRRKGRRARDD